MVEVSVLTELYVILDCESESKDKVKNEKVKLY